MTTIPQRYRLTDRWTDGQLALATPRRRATIASRGKNGRSTSSGSPVAWRAGSRVARRHQARDHLIYIVMIVRLCF